MVTDFQSYKAVIDHMQSCGMSVMMSEIHVLLRVHGLFVRFLQASDIPAMRKKEGMPKPDGNGNAVVRLPLMNGKKWVCVPLLQ